jgi:VIT1/CCC1 family predicted Fe2+/Mn2+ transporter
MKKYTESSEALSKRVSQVQGGAARAAVLGVNDGLVSTLCIILGVAGAQGSGKNVLLAGFAGLIAGAVSMAVGEWISVKSQVDLFEGVLSIVKKLSHDSPQTLKTAIEKNLVETGLEHELALHATNHIAADNNQLQHFYANRVLGLSPDDLGSPWQAAISSFALFTIGALVPLSPWFFTNGMTAIIISVSLTGLVGLAAGIYVAYTSGKNLTWGALRQLAIIVVASAVTYGVGWLFGTIAL